MLAIIAGCLIACKSEAKQENTGPSDLEALYSMMQGSYNSEAQAKADSSYYNISLHMYPVWEDKGQWLYVEQALNSMQDKPYRQRMYQLKQLNDSTFASYIYTIPHDSLWIGKWKSPKAFDSLDVKDLSIREGCEVILHKVGDAHFMGKTGDNTCESSLRGASFARSEVEMTNDMILSWDRGFDAEGNHVWGAEKGGYVFDKLE